MAAAVPVPTFKLGAGKKDDGRTVTDIVSWPATVRRGIVKSVESVQFDNGSFDVKLNTTMRLTKTQAESIGKSLKGLILPGYDGGLRRQGECEFHFDSSDLTVNNTRDQVNLSGAIIDPMFAMPDALLTRGYTGRELGMYVVDNKITSKPDKKIKYNLLFQCGKDPEVKGVADGVSKVCYNGRITLNIHLLKIDSTDLPDKKDQESFLVKLKEQLAVFALFLDPGTRIQYNGSGKVVTLDGLARGDLLPIAVPALTATPMAAQAMIGVQSQSQGSVAPKK